MAHLALSGDFAFPQRSDLMSLQTINKKLDVQKTTTNKFTTTRAASQNLQTADIQGKNPSVALSQWLARLGVVPRVQMINR